jgi:putative phosphoesterase
VLVGVLSDTHGLLRPSAFDALAGCDRILHAGDVGKAAILAALEAIAPVVAVRGNVDYGPGLDDLPPEASGDFEGLVWRMTHRPEDIPARWLSEARLVVHGHTHRPLVEWRGGCLLLNPGSCGPRRFHLPVSLAILRLDGGDVVPQIIPLEGESSPP